MKKTPNIPHSFGNQTMKRIKKVKKRNPVEQSSDGSDTEDIPPPQTMKKVKALTRKRRNTVSEVSSDTTVKSLRPENGSLIVKKRITKRASSTTEPADNSDSEDEPQKSKKKGKEVIKTEKPTSNDSGSDDHKPDPILKKRKHKEMLPDASSESDESEDDDGDAETTKHKKDLDHLKSVDPEFYEFLEQNNSELLDFKDDDALDESEEDDDNKSDGSGSGQEDKVHVPGDLHGGSDESDFETEGTLPKGSNVTLKMVRELQIELQNNTIKLGTITKTVKFFNAAVQMATSKNGLSKGEFTVSGASVFNAVLNLCVVYLPNAIGKYLGFETSGKDPQKCKHFVKIKSSLIEYLSNLVDLLIVVSSEHILSTMLKHLHQLCKYVACFSRISKNAIKKLLPLWSGGKETVRVLSFMCIVRITRNQEETLLVPVLKAMFWAYIKNSKFVSPTTWPGINFMRRSLVEMYKLDVDRSYPHVFLYVRQLGIHLRNAIVVPKLEHKQTVFNWQFMNALHLWAELVSQTGHHSGMKSLNFPLVMIISNSIKLGSTPQYYPLRFFLIELLMKMEEASGDFITIDPFFVDVITKFDINKKHKTASMKPLDFSCIIRLSKSQMNENGFKDAVVDRLYALLLEHTASLSYKIYFPECCMILFIFLRDLVDKCNNSNHKKKLKQLLDKIVENNDYMNKKRLTFDGHLAELSTIVPWEKQIKAQGTPLLTFYENWKKLNKIQKQKAITKNDELAGVMPLIKRPKLADDVKGKPDTKDLGPVDLFPSDSEDDGGFFKEEEDEKIPIPKKKVSKKEKKLKKVPKSSNSDELEVPDTDDFVSEFSW